jgi:Fur family transcriptional regulator, stress-responsive regulator
VSAADRTADGTADRAQVLRDAGLQVTAQRLAVYGEVIRQPHASAETVAAAVREALGSISTQAVYDALGALVEAGLVRRIQPAGSPARYEARVGDNHHHLICRTCGATVDVDCAVGSVPCLQANDDQGFDIDEAEVIYWGRCPDCRRAAERSQPRTTSRRRRAADENPRRRS